LNYAQEVKVIVTEITAHLPFSMPFLSLRRLLTSFSATVAVSVAAFGSSSLVPLAQAAPKAQDPPKAKLVRIGVSKFGALLNYLRARKTLEPKLAKLGVQVEWKEFVASPQLMEALAVDTVDVTYIGEPAPIFAQASVAVLVPKHSSLRTVSDLKDKRVAITKSTNSQFIVFEALDRIGLGLGDIQPVYLSPADGRIAFEGGKVDAWSTWDPFQTSAEKALGARILYDGKGLQPNSGYYLSTRAFADANKASIAVILSEIAAVNDFAAKNPRVIAETLSPKYGLPVEVLEAVERRRQHGLQPIDRRVIAGQQRIADAFYREKLLPKKLKIEEAVWRT
jgi:sulfonate transport system substrate-binding protein